jgi:hypothetical protein
MVRRSNQIKRAAITGMIAVQASGIILSACKMESAQGCHDRDGPPVDQ